MSSHYSIEELRDLGVTLPANPTHIAISKKASLYNAHLMSFGDFVRVDDFALLSGRIHIAGFAHIAAFAALYGGAEEVEGFEQGESFCESTSESCEKYHAKPRGGESLGESTESSRESTRPSGIHIATFCTISPKASIFATNDDFSGAALVSGVVASDFCNVKKAPVRLEKHTQIGSGAIVLPNVTCAVGTVLGALSLLKNSTKAFGIYGGIPARWLKMRSQNLLRLEKLFLENLAKNAQIQGRFAPSEGGAVGLNEGAANLVARANEAPANYGLNPVANPTPNPTGGGQRQRGEGQRINTKS